MPDHFTVKHGSCFLVNTGFNDNDNMKLVVELELVVIFVMEFAMNKRAKCRTDHSMVWASDVTGSRFPGIVPNSGKFPNIPKSSRKTSRKSGGYGLAADQ